MAETTASATNTAEADGGTWLRRFHPSPDSPLRIACFPHAGGSASFFFPLSKALTPAAEVLAVQYPGRQDRRAEPPIDDIAVLAENVCRALAPWNDRPLALFGHSMGAVIAFEVARRLEAQGTGPISLLASGRRAPSRHRAENVHQRDDKGIVAELRALSGTDQLLLDDEDVLQMILPAVRSDYRAIETYRSTPGAILRCPITLLTGDSDPRVSLDEAQAWSDHTAADFTLKSFPGGHFYLDGWPPQLVAEISTLLSGYTAH